MIASILSILGIGAAILWWWLQRTNNPLSEHRQRYDQINADISEQESETTMAHASADLDELERLERVQDQGARNP